MSVSSPVISPGPKRNPCPDWRRGKNSPSVSPSKFHAPDDLTELDQWVVWRYETRNGKPTKMPYSMNGSRADITLRGTWASFEEALLHWRCRPDAYAGLGFVFTEEDGLAGIDLDDSLDEQGDTKAWARGIVERFSDTYMEISPSGKGLKIWLRGKLPANLPGVNIGDGVIELYDRARYFTVTGRVFRDAPLQVEDHAEDLISLRDHLAAGRKGWSQQPLASGLIPHGTQHHMLVSLCGTLRLRRVCEEAIEACLQVVNQRQCEKPGERDHISQIVRSSRRWGKC